MTQFESLANELILDIYEFFYTRELFLIFCNLNDRFDQLLFIHFRTHQLNLQSILKKDLDFICENHLPLMIDKITSIHLSNEETPNISELLAVHGFTLDRFILLQSISLYKIHSIDTLIKITSQCRYLQHLTHFMMMDCSVSWWKEDAGFVLLNNIYNVANLTHCNLCSILPMAIRFSQALTISSSIKSLSMENMSCNLNFLSNLFQVSPHLQHLCINIESSSTEEYLKVIILSMISLKLSFRGSIQSMENLLQMIPNLCHLTINTFDICLNGHQWEQIIRHHLPKLQAFRFKMDKLCFFLDNVERQVDDLLNTFRNTFWLVEHQWFVLCRWNPHESTRRITVYTLPYAFNTFHYLDEYSFKSTCTDPKRYDRYNRVHTLTYEPRNISSHSFMIFIVCFSNIRHLNIELPWNDNVNSHPLSLNQLISLDVKLNNECAYSQLQIIFNYAPRLYSLKVQSFDQFQIGLDQLTKESILRLDLIDEKVYVNRHFQDREHATFFKSQLILQCEVLLINIEERNNVLNIIENMSHLRSLTFRCFEDEQIYLETDYADLNRIAWLQSHFPATYIITRDREKSFSIQIWIDRNRKIWNDYASMSTSKYLLFQFLTRIQRYYERIKKTYIMPLYRNENQ